MGQKILQGPGYSTSLTPPAPTPILTSATGRGDRWTPSFLSQVAGKRSLSDVARNSGALKLRDPRNLPISLSTEEWGKAHPGGLPAGGSKQKYRATG